MKFLHLYSNDQPNIPTPMAKTPKAPDVPPVAPPTTEPVPEAKCLQHARTFLEIKNVGCVIETLIYSEDGRMSVASVFVPGVYVHPIEGGPGELRKL
jgi:hypothetical protein